MGQARSYARRDQFAGEIKLLLQPIVSDADFAIRQYLSLENLYALAHPLERKFDRAWRRLAGTFHALRLTFAA